MQAVSEGQAAAHSPTGSRHPSKQFSTPDANDIAVQKPCVWGSMICICYFRLGIHRESGTKWDEMISVHSSVFQIHFQVVGERN